MKTRKNLKLILVSILTVSLLGGCAATSKTTTASNGSTTKAKKYTISTDATYAPFEYEKDGKYVGIDIDILAAIAKAEGFEYEIKPMNFKGIIPALTSNQIDAAIAGISITEPRKKVLDFSDGYYESGLSAVVSSKNTTINSLNDLNGKIFAVKKGTSGSAFAEANQDKYKGTIKYFDDTPAMFQEVINGNADVTFEDFPVVAYRISIDSKSGLRIAGDKINKDNYGFAVKKGENKELLDKFNAGLKSIKASGEYDKIVAKYITK